MPIAASTTNEIPILVVGTPDPGRVEHVFEDERRKPHVPIEVRMTADSLPVRDGEIDFEQFAFQFGLCESELSKIAEAARHGQYAPIRNKVVASLSGQSKNFNAERPMLVILSEEMMERASIIKKIFPNAQVIRG